MAAHVYTALKQIGNDIQNDRLNWSHLDGALAISCWTEDLLQEDYCELGQIVQARDLSDLRQYLVVHLWKYHQVWRKLGKPATREQWLKRQYVPK